MAVARAPRYLGTDRRVTAVPEGAAPLWVVGTLAVVTGVLVGGTVLVATAQVSPPPELRYAARGSLLLGGLLALAALGYWRATGRARPLALSAAAAALAVAAAIDLVSGPLAADLAAALRCALTLAAAAVVLQALRGPDVDTAADPATAYRKAAVTAGVLAVPLVVAALAVPVASRTVTGVLAGFAAAAWVAVAVVGARSARRRSQPLLNLVAWMSVMIAAARTSVVATVVDGRPWHVGGAWLEIAALLVVLVTTLLALTGSAVVRREDLYRRHLDGMDEARARADDQRHLAHEVSNAIMSVEGAARTLERYGDRLDETDRAYLEQAVASGLATIRELVLHRDAGRALGSYCIGEVVRERVVVARSRGVPVEVAGDPRHVVVGAPGPVRQVLDNLLLNAQLHAAAADGGPVTVAVDRANGDAKVRVEDRGPGVPPHHRERIFERGFRGHTPADGDGLGLHIARQLVHAQGGELWYEDRPGGGACFAFTVPAEEQRPPSSGRSR